MKLSKSDWKVKVFLWSYWYVKEFRNRGWDYDQLVKDGNTNLCEFVRYIVLWMPLTILTQIIAISSVVFALVFFPAIRLGWSRWWEPIAWIVGVAGCILLLLFICCLVSDFFKKYRKEDHRPNEVIAKEQMEKWSKRANGKMGKEFDRLGYDLCPSQQV